MSKVNKPHKGRRLGFRILIAAAIIASLSITAYAAEAVFGVSDWFQDIINREQVEFKEYLEEHGSDVSNARETMSQSQIDILNELGTVFTEQSYTDEGTTMTLTAAYGGDYIIHLYFKVEAPEGTVLPDDILYDFYDYNNDRKEIDGIERWYVLEVSEDAPYDDIGFSALEIEPLPDEDPTDNKKDFHVTIKAQVGGKAKFVDGYSKLFNVTGIYEQVVDADGDQDAYECIAPGHFTFDISIPNELETVEVDVLGLAYGGAKTRSWTHDSPCMSLCEENLTGEIDTQTGLPVHSDSWEISVLAESLKLTPLSAEWAIKYEATNGYSCGLEFRIVMKDGTVPLMQAGGGADGDTWANGIMYFVTPIDLDEIDYILVGDDEVGEPYKVYLPN